MARPMQRNGEILRDDLTDNYVNAWHLMGSKDRDQQTREKLIEAIRGQRRVLRRRTTMGAGLR